MSKPSHCISHRISHAATAKTGYAYAHHSTYCFSTLGHPVHPETEWSRVNLSLNEPPACLLRFQWLPVLFWLSVCIVNEGSLVHARHRHKSTRWTRSAPHDNTSVMENDDAASRISLVGIRPGEALSRSISKKYFTSPSPRSFSPYS